jgi:hypothetical protein
MIRGSDIAAGVALVAALEASYVKVSLNEAQFCLVWITCISVLLNISFAPHKAQLAHMMTHSALA